MKNKYKFFKILFLCIFLCFSCGVKYDTETLFPKTISELSRIKLVEGEDAIKMVNRLHGKPINIKRAWVAYYGEISDKNKKVTIWVSEAFSSFQAKRQTENMMKKIISSKGPFYNFQKSDEIFTFYGLGEKHAVFCKNRLVFWISASPDIYDDVLNYYKKLE